MTVKPILSESKDIHYYYKHFDSMSGLVEFLNKKKLPNDKIVKISSTPYIHVIWVEEW